MTEIKMNTDQAVQTAQGIGNLGQDMGNVINQLRTGHDAVAGWQGAAGDALRNKFLESAAVVNVIGDDIGRFASTIQSAGNAFCAADEAAAAGM